MLMSVTQSTAGTLVGNLCFIAMFPLLVSMHMQKGGYEREADVMTAYLDRDIFNKGSKPA